MCFVITVKSLVSSMYVINILSKSIFIFSARTAAVRHFSYFFTTKAHKHVSIEAVLIYESSREHCTESHNDCKSGQDAREEEKTTLHITTAAPSHTLLQNMFSITTTKSTNNNNSRSPTAEIGLLTRVVATNSNPVPH